MISVWILLLLGWALMAAVMLALWNIQRGTKNAGTVDVAWSAGIGLIVVLFAFCTDGPAWRKTLVAGLVGAWSFRLAFYLYRRVHGEAEDVRYRALREGWGDRAHVFFFWFFQFQAVLVVLFAIPPLIAMRNSDPSLTLADVFGIALWVTSVVGESIADLQLARFRQDPANRGQVCRIGLWRYSRHPNYFFEWIHWWAYCAFAIGNSWAWVTLLGPALMLFFLFKLTGIPPTEARLLASRGDAYRRYQRTTSVFFPWFPKGEGW